LRVIEKVAYCVKCVVVALQMLVTSCACADTPVEIAAYLEGHGQSPEDYVISKAASHKITLLGEAHWLKQDASFVAALVPALVEANIDLAVEVFPASQQAAIDGLITAPEWSSARANAVLRAANWPYKEYRDVLHSAWLANRDSGQRISVVALGPPSDWRSSLLPRGETYDSFMADRVVRHMAQRDRSVVVYTGMHHAFTRYYQAELSLTGEAMAYMDRMGNILTRRLGEQVFLIALHRPIWCGSPAEPSYCLPFAGRIDCAASRIGRPIGFDVLESPLAEMRFASTDYYAYGHAVLRFVDYTDGYVWLGSLDSFRPVTIIELDEFAPDPDSFRALMKSNPFTVEQNVTEDRLREIWAEQVRANRDIRGSRGWMHLSDDGCADLEDSELP
jgi:hypothetical protein